MINHVKLLLIDSTVFAEEVEPTGAVPMELSLERYGGVIFFCLLGGFVREVKPPLCFVKRFQKANNFVESHWFG